MVDWRAVPDAAAAAAAAAAAVFYCYNQLG